MQPIFGILLGIIFFMFPMFRCAFFNMFNVAVYATKDLIKYIKNRTWKKFKGFGINAYIGYYGKGKTLSGVYYAHKMYQRYGVKVYSNTPLNFPYEPFTNFQQMIDADDDCIFLIDEASTVFSHREWKNFPIDLLWSIFQCRHHHKELVLTTPRFQHIDSILRDVCEYAFDCRKKWRFMDFYMYDAWEMENCLNPTLLKPKGHKCFFVSDKVYSLYDTFHDVSTEMVQKFKNGELRDNKETMEARQKIVQDPRLNDLKRKVRKRF